MSDASAKVKMPTPGWYGLEAADPTDLQIEDPYPMFRALREQQPVNLTPEGNWRLSHYNDVHKLLRNVPCGMRRHDGLLPGRDTEDPGAGPGSATRVPDGRRLISGGQPEESARCGATVINSSPSGWDSW